MAEHLIKRDYDPHTGITEEFWYEEVPGPASNKIHIRRFQDVEDTLNHNVEQYNRVGATKGNMFADSNGVHKVATIPFAVIEKWLREDGFNWYTSTDAERRKKLNSSEFRKLRVRPGRL